MNRKILQKLIDELAQKPPRLDYICGVLETIIESLPPESTKTMEVSSTSQVSDDEAKALDSLAKAKMAEARRMSGETL